MNNVAGCGRRLLPSALKQSWSCWCRCFIHQQRCGIGIRRSAHLIDCHPFPCHNFCPLSHLLSEVCSVAPGVFLESVLVCLAGTCFIKLLHEAQAAFTMNNPALPQNSEKGLAELSLWRKAPIFKKNRICPKETIFQNLSLLLIAWKRLNNLAHRLVIVQPSKKRLGVSNIASLRRENEPHIRPDFANNIPLRSHTLNPLTLCRINLSVFTFT